MAELVDGKFVFSDEEQTVFDKIVSERVSRETKKIDALKLQLEAAIKDKANIIVEKDKMKSDFDKALKEHAETEAKFKNAGIEFDNLKSFTKDYQTKLEKLSAYEKAETLAKQKTAFVEAGGDPAKFDKAVKLVEFTEKSDAKTVFTELLKDDSWSILRAKVSGDPNTGDKSGEKPEGDEARKSSIGWAEFAGLKVTKA